MADDFDPDSPPPPLDSAGFSALRPELAEGGRLWSFAEVARDAERLVWTAYSSPSDRALHLVPGIREAESPSRTRFAGYVRVAKPWDHPDAEAEWLPPPRAVNVENLPPVIRSPSKGKGPPKVVGSLAAPVRPFVPPRPPRLPEDAKPEKVAHAKEVWRTAVAAAKRKHDEEIEHAHLSLDFLGKAREHAVMERKVQAAMPADLAKDFRFLSCRDGTAKFLVRTPAIRALGRMKAPQLLAVVHQAGLSASRVETKIGPFPEDLLSDRAAAPVSGGERSSASLREAAQTVQDEALRDQLLKLAAAIEAKKR